LASLANLASKNGSCQMFTERPFAARRVEIRLQISFFDAWNRDVGSAGGDEWCWFAKVRCWQAREEIASRFAHAIGRHFIDPRVPELGDQP
jgi:hypothetical protein